MSPMAGSSPRFIRRRHLVGLLLTVVSVAVWAYSVRRVMTVSYARPADVKRGALMVGTGVVDCRYSAEWTNRPYPVSISVRARGAGWRHHWGPDTRLGRWSYSKPNYDRIGPATSYVGRWGFALRWGNGDFALRVPCSYVTLALGLPTAFGLLRGTVLWRRHRRRRRLGLCLGCGYDLRGGRGRCPECGVEPASAQPAVEAARADAGGVADRDRSPGATQMGDANI